MADNDEKRPIDPETEEMLKEIDMSSEADDPSEEYSGESVETDEAVSAGNQAEDIVEPEPEVLAGNVETDNRPESGQSPKWYRNKRFLSLILMLVLAVASLLYFVVFSNDNKKTEDTSSLPVEVQNISRFGVAAGLVEGTVEISKDGASWSVLDADTDMVEGDHIRTGDNSRAVLLIDDGSALRLGSNTHAQLISLATEDVRIDNKSGEIYSRVVASDTRRFAVYVAGDLYEARGTAYRTISTEDKKGVEVYHSEVVALNKESPDEDVTVGEGNAYFTVNPEEAKKGVLSALDLEKLKDDEFIKWCAEQDKKEEEFADKLGFLADVDKPKVPVEPTPAPKQTTQTPEGITLSATQEGYYVKFSWSVKGVDAAQGFKLVASKDSQTPTYPENSATFIDAGKSSYKHFVGDGKTYHYRLCAYRGGSCDSYSNTVTAATDKKEEKQKEVESGAVTLVKESDGFSWTFEGTAPKGFKLLIHTSSNPTLESSFKAFHTNDQKHKFAEINGLDDGVTYYVKVCKYRYDGGCQDYSNEVTFEKP